MTGTEGKYLESTHRVVVVQYECPCEKKKRRKCSTTKGVQKQRRRVCELRIQATGTHTH
jgi:hypothetical protein